jgi:hypothetical protein
VAVAVAVTIVTMVIVAIIAVSAVQHSYERTRAVTKSRTIALM